MKALNKLAKFLFVSVLVFWLAPLNAATSSFIIDTDAGLDDIIAISYILNRPDISVKAITITGNGLTSCESGFRIISGLLSLKENHYSCRLWPGQTVAGKPPLSTAFD